MVWYRITVHKTRAIRYHSRTPFGAQKSTDHLSPPGTVEKRRRWYCTDAVGQGIYPPSIDTRPHCSLRLPGQHPHNTAMAPVRQELHTQQLKQHRPQRMQRSQLLTVSFPRFPSSRHLSSKCNITAETSEVRATIV